MSALGQHPALLQVAEQLRPGELLCAFLGDIYVVSEPERTRTLFDLVAAALREHAGIEVNLGKTRVWNAAGVEPLACRDLAPLAEDGSSVVWVGDLERSAHRRGVVVLGTPVGSTEFVHTHLAALREDHDRLLARIRQLTDLQSAWLILSFCANPRCN